LNELIQKASNNACEEETLSAKKEKIINADFLKYACNVIKE